MVTTRTALTTALTAPLTVGLLALGAGTAGADTVPDKNRVVNTDDGWQLSVTKTSENLDRYPNLAATMFTREGFVALEAVTARISTPTADNSVTVYGDPIWL